MGRTNCAACRRALPFVPRRVRCRRDPDQRDGSLSGQKKMSGAELPLAGEESAPGDGGHRLGPGATSGHTPRNLAIINVRPARRSQASSAQWKRSLSPKSENCFSQLSTLPVHHACSASGAGGGSRRLAGASSGKCTTCCTRCSPNGASHRKSTAFFNEYAGLVGLDLARFKRDVAGDEVRERVASDQKMGCVRWGGKCARRFFVNRHVSCPAWSLESGGVAKRRRSGHKERSRALISRFVESTPLCPPVARAVIYAIAAVVAVAGLAEGYLSHALESPRRNGGVCGGSLGCARVLGSEYAKPLGPVSRWPDRARLA